MRRLLFALSVCVFCLCPASRATETPPFDYLITGGLVFSGEEAPGAPLVVGIQGDRIVYVGAADAAHRAHQVIDATGLLVAPGFIDPHTHAWDERGAQGPLMLDSYLTQGITTVVSGNDGKGPADMAVAATELTARGLGANMALFAGHGTIRGQVMGLDDRAPTAPELATMKQLLAKAMDDGALGLSTGLFYAPGSFANTDEVIALAAVAGEKGGFYESHIRDESNYTVGLIAATEEAIEIGRKGGLPVHIAHIKALGVDVWGQSAEIVSLVEAARAAGVTVTADQYPWSASGTRISNALVPRWAMAGGRQAMLERLTGAATRDKILTAMAENLRRRGGPASILLTGGRQDWRGETLEAFAARRGETPIAAAEYILKEGDAGIASFNMNEADMATFMTQPWVMTSSDGGDGHPRKYASFPRKYTRYVRDKGLLTLPAFIHRSTALTADTFKLKDRGRLRVGAFADIVIFDPDRFRPVADFEQPARHSEGVVHLFVGGRPAITDGTLTGARVGQVLRRDGS